MIFQVDKEGVAAIWTGSAEHQVTTITPFVSTFRTLHFSHLYLLVVVVFVVVVMVGGVKKVAMERNSEMGLGIFNHF
ncbi:MAG: hypothetical protein ACXQTX_01825 [Candidatus Syntropharchaeia archaeon]